MGRYGDTGALRSSAGSLTRVADDLASIARTMPQVVPSDAWRGPSADLANAQLERALGHIRRSSNAQTRAAAIFTQLAHDLDIIDGEADEATRRALSQMSPIPMPGLVPVLTSAEAMQFASRAGAARQKAIDKLRSLADEVVLSAHIPYVPPEARRLQEEISGMAAEEKAIMIASLAGFFDPTPISDGTATILSLSSGDVPGALLSLLGLVPYLGDLPKIGKYGPKLKYVGYLDELGDAKKELNAVDTILDLTRDVDRAAGFSRLPNQSFVAGGYRFVTDEVGRPYMAGGILRLDPAGRTGVGTMIGKLGEQTDQGGHLLGARFGPPDLPFNVVPQSQFINQSVYKTVENEWDSLLKAGHTVDVKLTTTYDSLTTIRPDGFLIEYSVDGIEQPATYFLNQQR